ncbi:hypothetical protein [Algibacter pectinivorans]|uniref:Uncharacterized protein n=1 Tax=Algibacter pectinivorans TaxID=870482 RepID=A0A1I1PF93_9FLAO|nr:hypothetical protein [Algibacter pectinivorans]SFD08425.1 hypothetical protein SAMN04487987_103445 [Algibacter pectinivorans]
MTNTYFNKPPIWFWIISIIALVWNALGVDGYLGQAYNTERYRNSFTPEQLEIAANAPSWTMGAFAIAVFTGVLGAIFLLLRKKIATTFWLISLIAVLLQMGYALVTGEAASVAMVLIIIVFAIAFLVFSRFAASKHWIA